MPVKYNDRTWNMILLDSLHAMTEKWKWHNVDKDKFGWRNRKWTQQKMADIGQKYEDRTRNMILQCL